MKAGLYFLIVFLFISCSESTETKKPKEKQQQINFYVSSKEDTIVKTESHKSIVYEFIDSHFPTFDTLSFGYETNQPLYAGRLDDSEALFVKTLKFKSKNAVIDEEGKKYYQVIRFKSFEYADSIRRNIALSSWYNNFGLLAVKITPNKNLEGLKSPPFYAIVKETSISILFMGCEHADKNDLWIQEKEKLFFSLKNEKGKTTIIECGCGGPLLWENK